MTTVPILCLPQHQASAGGPPNKGSPLPPVAKVKKILQERDILANFSADLSLEAMECTQQ